MSDLQALIEKYNREMMALYTSAASPAPKANESFHEPVVSPDTASTSQETETSQTNEEATDIGQLQVRVSTENQAVPIPGSVVTITQNIDNQKNLIRTIITDSNGLTPLVDLPTKDRRLSLEPTNSTPYTVYTVDVTASGYFPKRFIDLPIYGGVTAVQSVSMIPLPENGDTDAVLLYPQSGPNL